MAETALLPPGALAGVRLAISVSESPDIGRLGFTEAHFRLALGEVARLVLVGGGGLAYGGHLDPDGYTAFLADELQRYGRRRDRPLLICLAWPEHRRVPLSALQARRRALGLLGEIVCLSPEGHPVDPAAGRDEDPAPVADPDLQVHALSSLRRFMRSRTQARVILGGRRHGFLGQYPGLLEEAILALEPPDPQPLYLAAGFGGVTADIARTLDPAAMSWLPPDLDAPPEDPRLAEGLTRLAALRGGPLWRGLDNGLTAEENRGLAATHRPGEIAVLVSLGLGRHFAKEG
jgi:hypothetical protein